MGEFLTLATVCILTLNVFAGAVGVIGMASRFPMVIGWDGLLPDWWSDLHPRFRTPVKALTVVTGACILVALVSSWSAGVQEINQIGSGGAVACLCIMYALLFAVILFGRRSLELRPRMAVKLAALSGFLVSLASLPFQIVPITGVTNPAVFALKVGGLVCAINALEPGYIGRERSACGRASSPRRT
jgi:glutamate:GABA antiporter